MIPLKAAPAQNGSQPFPAPGPGSTVKAAKPGQPSDPARFSHIPTAPAPTGFSGALRRRSHGNVQKPPPPRIPLKGESGSSASSSALPAPCSLLPLRKALNAGSAYARLSSCNRFQGRLTHWAMLRIHPKPIERAQDPWNPRVVKDGDLQVRFDTISLIVLNEQRAFLRHHTNVFSQA